MSEKIKNYLLNHKEEFEHTFDTDEDLLNQIDLIAKFLFENSKKIEFSDKKLLIKFLFSQKLESEKEVWKQIQILQENFAPVQLKPVVQSKDLEDLDSDLDSDLASKIKDTFHRMIVSDGLTSCSKQSLQDCLNNFLRLKIIPNKDTLYVRRSVNNTAIIQDNYLYTRQLLCEFLNCKSIVLDLIFKDEVKFLDEFYLKHEGRLEVGREFIIPPSGVSADISFENIAFVLVRTFLKDSDKKYDTYRLYSAQALTNRQKTEAGFWTKRYGDHVRSEMLKKSALRMFAKDFIANGGDLLQKIDIAIAKQIEKFNC